MSKLLDNMNTIKNSMLVWLDDINELNQSCNDNIERLNNKVDFQHIIIQGLFKNLSELVNTINKLNVTIMTLSNNLENEIKDNQIKTEKIELLHFKIIETQLKNTKLKKIINSIKNTSM